MARLLKCPACFEPVPVGRAVAGRTVVCRNCDHEFRLPGSGRAGRTGRGLGFWFAVAGGVAAALAVALVAACGGLVYWLTAPDWQPYPSAAGGFTIDFPAAPQADPVNRLAGVGVPLVTESATLWLQGEEFIAGYGAETLGGPSDVAALDLTLDGIIKAWAGSTVITRSAPDGAGLPAREVILRTPDGGVVVARTVLAGPRVFVLVATGRGSDEGNPRLRRFVDSLVVTDPYLLAAAERRKQDAARRAAEQARLEEKRRKAAEEELAYQARLQRLRDEFQVAGGPAPDPDAIPGLVLHLGFDDPDPMWPKSAGTLNLSAGGAAGPGVRGAAR